MEFHAEFTSTAEDLVTARRMQQKRGEERWRTYIFGAIFALIVFAVIGLVSGEMVVWGLGLGFALIILFLKTMFEWMEGQFLKKMKKLPEAELTVKMSGDGLHLRGSDPGNHWTGHHAWDQFKQVRMDDRGILFFTRPQEPGLFVPARAFGATFPREALRKFFHEVIKNPDSKAPADSAT